MKDKYAKGISFDEFEKENFSEDEINESRIRAKYICALANLRNEHKITQKQLEELTGIKQPMIARIESGETIPRVDTLIRLLEPMGLTIQIVPTKENAKY